MALLFHAESGCLHILEVVSGNENVWMLSETPPKVLSVYPAAQSQGRRLEQPSEVMEAKEKHCSAIISEATARKVSNPELLLLSDQITLHRILT